MGLPTFAARPEALVVDIVMSRTLKLSPDVPAGQTATVVRASHVDAAPVVDANGDPVGVVTWSDLIGLRTAEGEDF